MHGVDRHSREITAPDKLTLISCVSRKAGHPAAAAELYTSAWFRKARAYVESRGEPWMILSAEHGLLDPATVIAPYETTLNTMPVKLRREWALGVLEELVVVLAPGACVVFLAGKRYRELLRPALEERGHVVEVPMAGLAIGQQMQWLNRQMEKQDG